MVLEFKFPDVGEGITEGKLVSWKVKVGDTVKVDSPICDVETDKATVDIPSPVTGKVIELIGNPSDILNVGDVIMKIDSENTTSTESTENKVEEKVEIKPEVKTETTNVENTQVKAPEENKIPEPKVEEPIKVEEDNNKVYDKNFSLNVLAMPSVRSEAKNNNIDLNSIKPTGKHGEITLEDLNGSDKVENTNSEKPTVQNENIENTQNNKVEEKKEDISESNLKIGEIPVNEESKIPVTDVKKEKEPIPEKHLEDVEEIDVSDIAKEQELREKEKEKPKDVVASPSVRQLARDLDVDINFVLGSGDGGKITEEDIKRAKELKDKYVKPKLTATQNSDNAMEKEDIKSLENTVPKVEVTSPIASHTSQSDSDTIIPIQGIRKIISERMLESLSKSAQVTLCDEANITEIVNLRNREKDRLKEKGIKLNYIPFFIKAFIETSKEFPKFNSVVDDEKNEVILKSNFNIGIAADTNKGLLVPVIQMCEHKNILELSREIVDLSTAAREGKLKPEQMKGSTFTISSVGSLGGQFFTPIINYPETAVLGIGKIIKKPVYNSNDEIVPAQIVSLSLTFDHRVIDGADAAKFMKKFVELLENPEEILLTLE